MYRTDLFVLDFIHCLLRVFSECRSNHRVSKDGVFYQILWAVSKVLDPVDLSIPDLNLPDPTE